MECTKENYLKIIAFLTTCGGTYTHLEDSTCINILDALIHERIYIAENEAGELQRVVAYWMIHQEDVAMVRDGLIPDDVDSGSIIYVAEHAGIDGTHGVMAAANAIKEERTFRAACWHHRWNRPDTFRYRKMEVNNEAL